MGLADIHGQLQVSRNDFCSNSMDEMGKPLLIPKRFGGIVIVP